VITETQKVHKHGTVRKLRLVVETVDLAAILGNGGERDNIVEIESQCRVNVVNKHLHILFGALVQGNDGKSGTTAAETLENSLDVAKVDGNFCVIAGIWAIRGQQPLADPWSRSAYLFSRVVRLSAF
jgi:hypothetical protein